MTDSRKKIYLENQPLDNDSEKNNTSEIIKDIEKILECDLSDIAINNNYDLNILLNNPSIRNVLSHRLKINAVWSKRGAKIMAMLLCLYREGRLDATLDYILSNSIDVSELELETLVNRYYSNQSIETSNSKKINLLSAQDIIKSQMQFAN